MKKIALFLVLIATPAFAAHTEDGVVYDANGIVREVIVPDNDSEIAQDTPAGDSVVIVQDTNSFTPALANGYVAAAIGKQPPSPRCIVTDAQGNVVAVLLADPKVDVLPGYAITANATNQPGDVVTPVAVAPGKPVVTFPPQPSSQVVQGGQINAGPSL